MADDRDDEAKRENFSRLVSEVADALARGVAAPNMLLPMRDPRGHVGTGADALVYERVKAEILRDVSGAIRESMERDVERLRADIRRECADVVRERTQAFLPDTEIEKRINQRFEDAGLPMDREHRQQTSEAVRSWLRWQKRIDKVLGGMALAVLTAVMYGLARMIGINLPMPGSEHAP